MARIIGGGERVVVRIINSVGGIGDILFSEPIFRHYWKTDGEKPVVIIHPHQMWIQEYIESAEFSSNCPDVFKTESLFHKYNILNLRYANQIFRGLGPHDHHDLENMMLDKYRLLGLPEDLWKTLDVKLSSYKSLNLVLNHKIQVNEFTLINEYSQAGNINIKTDNFYYKIWFKMFDCPGYNVIDWWRMIYNATENHHVSTSTFFLMQAIKNKYPDWNAPCYIYPRPNIDGLHGISQLKPDFNLIRVER